MSMTRSEFNMAFSTVIEEEFANIPDESEIEFEFSDEFNRKMQELIDSIGANNGQQPKNDRKSRLNIKGLIALAATLALLLAGLVSVNATGNPIVNFIVRGRRRGRNRPRLCVHGSARRVYGNGTGAE